MPVSGAELTRRIEAETGGGLQHYLHIYTLHTIHYTLHTTHLHTIYTIQPRHHMFSIVCLALDPPPELGDQAALFHQLALQTVQPRPAVLVLRVVPVHHTQQLVRADYSWLELA